LPDSSPTAPPVPPAPHTSAAALSTPAAPPDAPPPVGTDTAARSSPAPVPSPSARTCCRYTASARRQTENTRNAGSVSASRLPIARDETPPAPHTIARRDAPSTEQTKRPTRAAPCTPQSRALRSPSAPSPKQEDK